MSCKLSDLVDTLSEIYNAECIYCRKKIQVQCKLISFKNDGLHYKCEVCGKRCVKLINEAVKSFPIFYRSCKGNLNNFFLLLRKGVYLYEYMDSWEKFDKTTILPKETFYSELNGEGISDADYAHIKTVCEVFKIKNWDEYHNLYAQSDTFLLADVFESFRNMCLKEYGLNPAHFLTVAGLTWDACLKKNKSRIRIINGY